MPTLKKGKWQAQEGGGGSGVGAGSGEVGRLGKILGASKETATVKRDL
jgi:hypothetical protein